MKLSIRDSKISDLNLLELIEKSSFELFQRSSRRSLHLSLSSPFQKVFFAELMEEKKEVGCVILHTYKHTLRVFSIAVLPEYQGAGVGSFLLKQVEYHALSEGYERISIEVDADNRSLISWYTKRGYQTKELIKDYYDENKDAFRMVLTLNSESEETRTSNVVVVDSVKQWPFIIDSVKVVSAREYTSLMKQFARKNLRIFNLCTSYSYQSLGYYVSLLASAREHRAFPNVTTIRDLNDFSIIKSITEDIDEEIQKALLNYPGNLLKVDIYFGQTNNPALKNIVRKLYHLFEVPLVRVHFKKTESWEIKKFHPLRIDQIPTEELDQVRLYAEAYFRTQRFKKTRLKPYKYDLAILINPDEPNPPSNKKALKLLKEAAENSDLFVEFIQKDDLVRLSEFDALFIRETTNVNDHTYQFARKAYAEGLVVIDDPWSILRCSNKIYLNERLVLNGLKTPGTYVFFKGKVDEKKVQELSFPMILKQPDSAFSKGVLKVNTHEELIITLKNLFKKSELIIGQVFMPSEFDWRIGVLDNKPLFACKYYMAKGHWQIYDWKSSKKDPSGDSETIPISDVPVKVLQAAIKAASLMGDGLYGVDLKEINGEVLVIEVNDNPNIDAGVEDQVLKIELYDKIMRSFINRIEMSRNLARFVSLEPV